MLEVTPTALELHIHLWSGDQLTTISENSKHYLGKFPRDKEKEEGRRECSMLIGASQGRKGELLGCSANRKAIPEPGIWAKLKASLVKPFNISKFYTEPSISHFTVKPTVCTQLW